MNREEEIRSPNFIIGGTSAGGTSFMSAIMIQHPEIYMPAEMRPEPHFFYKSWEYEKGANYYLSKWFSKVPRGAVAVGERSSSYLFGGREVAKRVVDQYPEIKLIFVLRNPMERAWANYRYTVLQGLEDLSFEDALAREDERVKNQRGIWSEIQPHNYTGRSFYGKQIKEFYEFFHKDNILILKSELLSSETSVQMAKIYSFLGLNLVDYKHLPVPNFTSVNVVDAAMQKQLRDYFGNRFDSVIETIRKEQSLESLVDSSSDKEMLQKLKRNMTGKKQLMKNEQRKYLRKLFFDDMLLLKEYVDFDITDWV